MTEFSTYERIEAYLADRLSPEDLAAFEKDLAASNDLQREVERHRRAHQVIKHAYYQDLKHRLGDIDAETQKPRARIRPLLRKIAIAAALAGAVAIAGTLWINQSYSNTSIAEDFLASVPEEQFRGAETEPAMTIEDRFAEAEKLFNQGSYAEAEQAYTNLARAQNGYAPLAEWNLALCALALGKKEVFDTRLRPILDNEDHDFHYRARALKQKIDTRFYQLAN